MKEQVIAKIISKLEADLATLKEASQTSKDYAQSDDLKSEGKYDTRAIEAKYLAEAQEVRVQDLINNLAIVRTMSFQGTQRVGVGSLVYLDKLSYFILPIPGQGKFEIDGFKVVTISKDTAIAQELISLEKGDVFESPISGKEFLITKVD